MGCYKHSSQLIEQSRAERGRVKKLHKLNVRNLFMFSVSERNILENLNLQILSLLLKSRFCLAVKTMKHVALCDDFCLITSVSI